MKIGYRLKKGAGLSTFRKSIVILALIVNLVIAAGCGELDQGALSIIMSSQERHAQVLAEAFEKETGIRVYMAWISSPETVVRLRQEKDNPSFSVWWGGSAETLVVAKKEGLLDPLDMSLITHVPNELKDSDGAWSGVLVNPVVFVYNPGLLEKRSVSPPKSWEDVLGPQMEGQIVMAKPDTTLSGQAAVRTLYALGKNGFDQEQLLRRLSQNVAILRESGVGVVESVANGDAIIGITLADEVLTSMDGKRSLAIAIPQEGSAFQLNGLAVIKGARQSKQAKMFYQWALSKRAQELGAGTKDQRIPVNQEARRTEFKSLKFLATPFDSLTSDANAATELFYRGR